MKCIEKNLTLTVSGEQVRQAIACTFRAHAGGVKSAATIRYMDGSGIEKTFFALNVSLDPLFAKADEYDTDVISRCLLTAGYRSGRDLTAFETAVKTAESAAAPLIKRDNDLRKAAAACGDGDVTKHSAIMAEITKNGPALAAARDAVEKAKASLAEELMTDINAFLNGFEKRRAAMLTAVSKWLYAHAADRFPQIAQAADAAVREHAREFAGRMLAYVDSIAADEEFPLNYKGRRCSCGGNVEDAILKAVKRPFNGGVGYRHTATGGTRYCDVPRKKAGVEVEIAKAPD